MVHADKVIRVLGQHAIEFLLLAQFLMGLPQFRGLLGNGSFERGALLTQQPLGA